MVMTRDAFRVRGLIAYADLSCDCLYNMGAWPLTI
jgi:hypothetical protein